MIEHVYLEHVTSKLDRTCWGYRPQAEATMERSKNRATLPPPKAQQCGVFKCIDVMFPF